MSNTLCPVCENELKPKYFPWHSQCKECHYENADLQVKINLPSSQLQIDECERKIGLQDVRCNNFKILLAIMKLLKPNGGRLLEVGCAHGLFLNIAKNDYSVFGIEPDQTVFDIVSHAGFNIRNGYFPEILDETEKFDVIIFNDVIEHIPNIQNILKSCYQHLNKEGILVLNLPSSKGIFYKLSKILCRFGFSSFFERMWQKDLPSPHLHYFDTSNISSLLKKNNFIVKQKGNLPSLTLSGLYKRISYTKNFNLITRLIIYVSTLVFLPFLKILPKDIMFLMATRE